MEVPQRPLCGGVGDTKQADAEVQALVDQLRDHIHAKSGKKYSQLKAVQYKSQVVAGTNYFVKVHTGDEHIHLRIFKPLPFQGTTPELHGLQLSHSAESPIDYFQ